MLIGSWNNPYDPQTLISVKLDITNTETYLEKLSADTGEKLTLTTFVIRLMGLVLKKNPEICGYIRFGAV